MRTESREESRESSDGARALVRGTASGEVLVLDSSLSFWGGLDPATGRIIDRRHPQLGECVTGFVLAMPDGRGSSSSSTVLAEAIRLGTAPVAIILREPDGIVALGAIVAGILYGRVVPVLRAAAPDFALLRTGQTVIVDGDRVSIVAGGHPFATGGSVDADQTR
jgi:predicted aconitase with swiveling domain